MSMKAASISRLLRLGNILISRPNERAATISAQQQSRKRWQQQAKQQDNPRQYVINQVYVGCDVQSAAPQPKSCGSVYRSSTASFRYPNHPRQYFFRPDTVLMSVLRLCLGIGNRGQFDLVHADRF